MQFTEETEKQLALMMERDGLEWFSTGDGEEVRIWEGNESQEAGKWTEYCQELEGDGKADEEPTFEEWLQENGTEVDVEEYDENGDWKVYTDSEADDAWDDDLENYIDECILPELNERYHMYFDREKWKGDARIDGRGHSLSRYDSNECEQTVNGTTYYLYRQN